MGIGHDEPVSREDETRTHTTGLRFFILRPVLARTLAGLARQGHAEKAPEELLHLLIGRAWHGTRGCLTLFKRADIDH